MTLLVAAFTLRSALGVKGLAAAELLSLIAYVTVLGLVAGRRLSTSAGIPWPRLARVTLAGGLMWWVAVMTRAGFADLPTIVAAGLAAAAATGAYLMLSVLTGDAKLVFARLAAMRTSAAERP